MTVEARRPRRDATALARLVADPRRFTFDAAIRILMRVAGSHDPADAARFRSQPGLATPPADVLAVQPQDRGPPAATLGLIGMAGSSGVLPRFYTEVLTNTLRQRSDGLHRFLDMLAQRMVGMFAWAGIKYRPHRAADAALLQQPAAPDRVADALLALTGYGTAHTGERLAAGMAPLLHYAGLFQARPRSADRLEALVSDWLGRPVEVRQFSGSWLPIPPEQRSRTGRGRRSGAFSRLGVDAAIGVRAWDIQARVVLHVGPLDQAAFHALLPDRPALVQLVSLIRAFVGFETGFAINPVLQPQAVPPMRLDVTADPPPRLGWNTWLPTVGPRRLTADEAVFEGELVEAHDPALAGQRAGPRTRRATRNDGMSYGSGYVTDVEYMIGFYPKQAPQHLDVACLLGGVATDLATRRDNLCYLELGSGLGYGAMVLAAGNPGWQVFGIDFNPAHIAFARGLAAAAGLSNITFLEADLASFAEEPEAASLPAFDVISLHGVWSWVSLAVRAGIMRLMRAKLRAGGVAHVSYNSLPTWQAALGLQRVVREAGQRLARRSDRQVGAGLETVEALAKAEARHVRGMPFAMALLSRMKDARISYLAHEYMNENWNPCFHADVAADLAPAKLEWTASASLVENFLSLALTEAQREVAVRFDDPIMIELLKDQCLERGLRHDIFVRGAQRVDGTTRDALLSQVILALAVPPEQFRFEIEVPTGTAQLGQPFYGAVVDRLARGPCSVDELLALPGRTSSVRNPAELVAVLVDPGQAAIVSRPGAAPDAGARRFNEVVARRLVNAGTIGYPIAFASVRMGGGVRAAGLEVLMLAEHLRTKEGGSAPDAEQIIAGLGGNLDETQHGQLREAIHQTLTLRPDMWRALGAC